jgi:opacity protein-like surface antigen
MVAAEGFIARAGEETMKKWLAAAAIAAMVSVPAAAQAQSGDRQIQGFGGLSASGLNASPTFGGSLAMPITENLHIIAEGGRMRDVTSPVLATLIDLTPVDVRLSALYGKAGLRVLSSNGPVRPYAEVTAGFARLTPEFGGAGSRNDAIINVGLQFLNRTEPMYGAGGGVLLQGGPVVVDLGYRYNRFSAGGPVQSVLTAGNIGMHQMRLGIGVRF